MRVYYLSQAPFALSNISLRRIKVSRFSDLNDPFELLAVYAGKPDLRKAFDDMKLAINRSLGLLCFSRQWSNPVMWGHYADRHTGIALGFDVPDSRLHKVHYTNQRIKLEYDGSTGFPRIDDALLQRLQATKFKDWAYEEEYRLFIRLDKIANEAGLFFTDFDDELALAEVILGPRCELPIERVREMVGKSYPRVHVMKARMAYRTFRVTEDRTRRRQRSVA